MASFSVYGTTEDEFAKPDLVAPGRNILSLLASTDAHVYTDHPDNRVDTYMFRMSGTSMSAPMVSGAVALLLQNEPTLNPDQVKYRLMATANNGWSGYSATTAGAGYLDINAAVETNTTATANTGIQVSQLLSRTAIPSSGTVSAGIRLVGTLSAGIPSVGTPSAGIRSAGIRSVGTLTAGMNKADDWRKISHETTIFTTFKCLASSCLPFPSHSFPGRDVFRPNPFG